MIQGPFHVYSGRPWPVEQVSDERRCVAHFDTFLSAREAFLAVDFVALPSLAGRLRWRGWSPQLGMIVQIERPIVAVKPTIEVDDTVEAVVTFAPASDLELAS